MFETPICLIFTMGMGEGFSWYGEFQRKGKTVSAFPSLLSFTKMQILMSVNSVCGLCVCVSTVCVGCVCVCQQCVCVCVCVCVMLYGKKSRHSVANNYTAPLFKRIVIFQHQPQLKVLVEVSDECEGCSTCCLAALLSATCSAVVLVALYSCPRVEGRFEMFWASSWGMNCPSFPG